MDRNVKSRVFHYLNSPFGRFLVSNGGGRLFAEWSLYNTKRSFLKDAIQNYSSGSTIGSLDDYKQSLKTHWVSFNEYAFQYEFHKLSEDERDDFVSRLKMDFFYRRYTPFAAKLIFREKRLFLNVFKAYVHREWLYAPESTYEAFEKLVTKYDCIVKPCDGNLGRGIFKIPKDYNKCNLKELFNSCVNDHMLVEQCIDSCKELRDFHPQSLNTIRVVTVSNREKAMVFGSFLRTGVGDSVVDNAHAGGIFAQIDVQKGVIESDGIDTNNNHFENHPDSGLQFKGFQIPHWETILSTCCEAAKETDSPIVGFDVAINHNGQVELVEGNYGPDFDVMQSPLKIGVKKRLFSLIHDYTGIELK